MMKIILVLFCLLSACAFNVRAQESAPFKITTADCVNNPPPYANDFSFQYELRAGASITIVRMYKDARAAAWLSKASVQLASPGDTLWNPQPLDDATLYGFYQLLVQQQFYCDTHADDGAPMHQREMDGAVETLISRTSGITRKWTLDSQIPDWAKVVIDRVHTMIGQH